MYNEVESELPLNNNAHEKPKEKDESTFWKPTLSLGSSPLNQTKLNIKKGNDDSDEDTAYGVYVSQSLNYINNITIKQDIKLEIDHIFYSYRENNK